MYLFSRALPFTSFIIDETFNYILNDIFLCSLKSYLDFLRTDFYIDDEFNALFHEVCHEMYEPHMETLLHEEMLQVYRFYLNMLERSMLFDGVPPKVALNYLGHDFGIGTLFAICANREAEVFALISKNDPRYTVMLSSVNWSEVGRNFFY